MNFALRARLPQKPHFTQQALSKALEGRRITFKIARLSCERNSEENIEDRYNYALWIMSPDVISSRKNFVDEFGVLKGDLLRVTEFIERSVPRKDPMLQSVAQFPRKAFCVIR